MNYSYYVSKIKGMLRFSRKELLYHGTSTVFERQILKHGLIPNPPQKVYNKGDSHLETLGGIYFSFNVLEADAAAGSAVRRFGGEKLLVEANIELKTALIDEDSLCNPEPILEEAFGLGFNGITGERAKLIVKNLEQNEIQFNRAVKKYLQCMLELTVHKNIDVLEKNRWIKDSVKNYLKAWLIGVAKNPNNDHYRSNLPVSARREAEVMMQQAGSLWTSIIPEANEDQVCIRVKEPVTFSGSNHILSMFKIRWKQVNWENYPIIIPIERVYGVPSSSTLSQIEAGGKRKIKIVSKETE